MPTLFSGSCPICSTQLLVDDAPPETASCYCPEKHYSCNVKDFNKLWEEFEAQVKRLGPHKAGAKYAEKLLKDLRALNTVQEQRQGEHGTE